MREVPTKHMKKHETQVHQHEPLYDTTAHKYRLLVLLFFVVVTVIVHCKTDSSTLIKKNSLHALNNVNAHITANVNTRNKSDNFCKAVSFSAAFASNVKINRSWYRLQICPNLSFYNVYFGHTGTLISFPIPLSPLLSFYHILSYIIYII